MFTTSRLRAKGKVGHFRKPQKLRMTDIIKRLVHSHTAPPYSWSRLEPTLTEEEQTKLVVNLGQSYRSFVIEIKTICYNSDRKALPKTIRDKSGLFTQGLPNIGG